jgi:hypothetical protein
MRHLIIVTVHLITTVFDCLALLERRIHPVLEAFGGLGALSPVTDDDPTSVDNLRLSAFRTIGIQSARVINVRLVHFGYRSYVCSTSTTPHRDASYLPEVIQFMKCTFHLFPEPCFAGFPSHRVRKETRDL